MFSHVKIIFFSAILICLFPSCTCSTQDVHKDAGNNIVESSLEVPFVKQQNEGFCGPAALTMILHYWGDFVSQQEIANEIYLPSVNGSLSFDLLRYVENRGFSANLYHGSLQDIRECLAAGFPLLVVLGQGKNMSGHYVVVVGDNTEKQSVIIHDGIRAYRDMPYQKFMTLWGKMDRIILRIAPKGLSD